MYYVQCDIFLNNPQVTSCNASYFTHTKNKCPNCTSVTTELPTCMLKDTSLICPRFVINILELCYGNGHMMDPTIHTKSGSCFM